MKALKICGWLFLAVSVIHGLVGIISGEFGYPSMKALWLTAIAAGGFLLAAACFAALALMRRAGGKTERLPADGGQKERMP